MKQRFFVTATGTGIGKSFITAALVRQAKARQLNVTAYKPLMSGFDPLNPHMSDTGVLLRSMDLAITPKNIERISPWRYAAPLAPPMAAHLENTAVDFDAVVAYSRYGMSGPEDLVILEGVGGVMSPISHNKTVLDWIDPLHISTILITGSYLGSISHTLTALAVLQQRTISVAAIIINESTESNVSLEQTAEGLKPFTTTDILTVKRRKELHAHEPIEEIAFFFA